MNLRSCSFILISCCLIHLSTAVIAAENGGDPRKQRVDVKALPPVTEWIDDTEGKVKARTEAAFLKGPEALEQLAHQLQTVELRDKDGFYTTPLFYRDLGNVAERLGEESKLEAMQRTIEEWRRQFPESKAATLALARFYNEYTAAAQQRGVGVPNMDEKWKIVEERSRKALQLLEQCQDLKKTDPAWFTAYFIAIRNLGVDRSVFQKAADDLGENFPECGYAFSRAVFYLFEKAHGSLGEWEPWLRQQVKKLPPDVAAKCYARTIIEVAVSKGFTATQLWVSFDLDLLRKGLDLMQAEYPDSASIACADASVSAYILNDRRRAFDAFKRAKGRIFLANLYSKAGYEYALYIIGSIPWNPQSIGIPAVKRQIYGMPEEFNRRMEDAAKAGPKSLEELIQHLRSEEIFDKDGDYISCLFFDWFEPDIRTVKDYHAALEKKEILERWRKEYPASPFAMLASAQFWVSYAWDARGTEYASGVGENQWDGFRDRLKIARSYLMNSRELQESEPAWSGVAIHILLGEGDSREEFEEITDELFKNFPECDSVVGQAHYYLTPKWGGRPGEWEPWLKSKLKDVPEDVRARAYTRGIIDVVGYAFYSTDNEKEVFNGKKPDLDLLWKGMKLLKEKYPDSLRIHTADAMFHSHYSENVGACFNALQKMDGVLDMDVWYSYDYYDRVVRFVTWKKTEAAAQKK